MKMDISAVTWTAVLLAILWVNTVEMKECIYNDNDKKMYCDGIFYGHLTPDMYPVSKTGIISLYLLGSVSSFDYRVFYKLKYLKNLYIHSNRLKNLDRRLFHYPNMLEVLELKYNGLTILSGDIFSNLRNLKYLDISHNKLTSFNNSEIFKSQTNLLSLNLESNLITFISREALDPLESIEILKLDNNPFTCSSEIQETVFWTKSRCLNTRASCAGPPEFKGTLWSNLRMEMPEYEWHNNTSCMTDHCSYIAINQIMDCSNLSLKYFEKDNLPFTQSKILSLYLNGNEIESLKSGAFDDWPGLKDLKLTKNRLRKLEFDLLYNLTEIQVLDLTDNQIESLDRNLFRYQSKLKCFYISYNNISTLPGELLEPLVSLQIFEIASNPLSCDCRLQNTLFIISRRNIHTKATCGSPGNLTGQLLMNIKQEINCMVDVKNDTVFTYDVIFIIVVVFFLCLGCAGLCYFCIMCKRYLKPETNDTCQYDDIGSNADTMEILPASYYPNSDISGIYSYPVFNISSYMEVMNSCSERFQYDDIYVK